MVRARREDHDGQGLVPLVEVTGAHARARLALVAAVALGAFFLALDPIADGDIFWHLAAGREMVRQQAWLRTDPFTTSAGGRPWIDVHWLFQLAMFAVWRVGGLAGVVVVKALAVAMGASILVRAVGRAQGIAGMVSCAIGLLTTLFLARHLLLARPVVVSLIMLSLTLAALEASRTGATRPLLALPVLQILWVNCQGGLAVLGPIMVTIYLAAAIAARLVPASRWPFAGEGALPVKRLGLTLGFCALASLITPYGWQTWLLPGRLFTRVAASTNNVFSAEIAENAPAWISAQSDSAAALYLPWVLAATAIAVVLGRGGVAFSRLLVVSAFAGLALLATRNVLLFYWLLPPIVSLEVAPAIWRWWNRSDEIARGPGARGRRRWVAGVAALVLCAQLTLVAAAATREGSIAVPVPFHFPTESAQLLRRMGAAGPIFAPDHHGGYLEWTVPALRPYIDTRLVLHTEEEYAAYLATLGEPMKFDALADSEAFAYVVLTTSYPDRYLGLAQHLMAHPAWSVIFTDGSEILFARAGTTLAVGSRANTDAILRALEGRFWQSPAKHEVARMNLARLLVVWGETAEAQAVLSTSRSRAAAQLRARAYIAAGQTQAAEALSLALLLSDEDDVRSLALLAQIAALRGDAEAGGAWLRRALTVAPYDPEALALLRTMEHPAQGSADPPAR